MCEFMFSFIHCITGSPCRYHQFQCRSRNQCIPRSFHCDMESDCLDGSDEVGCCKYSSAHYYALHTEFQGGCESESTI